METSMDVFQSKVLAYIESVGHSLMDALPPEGVDLMAFYYPKVALEVSQFVHSPSIVLLQRLLLFYFFYSIVSSIMGYILKYGFSTPRVLFKSFLPTFFKFLKTYIPFVRSYAQKEVDKAVNSIQGKMLKSAPVSTFNFKTLPKSGLSDKQVRQELDNYSKVTDHGWKKGRVSGAIYHGGDDLSSLLTEAYGKFSISNPLHPEIWPGIRQMEAEVVSMVLNMYNAPSSGCGSVTSGGTESILMACKTYREMARDLNGVTKPEMIIPVTAHAAFDKAGHYFGIEVIHIPMLENGKVDVRSVKSAINRNTIMIVGSAPNFPHGIIDDIPALAALAKKYNVGMHVDACLGGFIVPFMAAAGYKLPHKFDFSVNGVTSISCDPHKYGFAPKGSSVVMYRSKAIRKYQYHVMTDWPGGVYASPAVSGSRPGALIAGCWAAMIRNGEDGYIASTKKIVEIQRKITKSVEAIPELDVIGTPLVTVMAFRANTVHPNVKTYAVADILSRKGWHLNILQFPPAIHIACTLPTLEGAQDLIGDIKQAVTLLKKDPEAGSGEVGAIYGTAASVPDRSIIGEVTHGFLDALTMI